MAEAPVQDDQGQEPKPNPERKPEEDVFVIEEDEEDISGVSTILI